MTNINNASKATLERAVENGLYVTTLRRSACAEFFITATPHGDETPADLFVKAGDVIKAHNAQIVSVDVFGVPGANGAAEKQLTNGLGPINWPCTWVEGTNTPGLCGVIIWAIAGLEVTAHALEGRPFMMTFEDADARYARIGDARPTVVQGPRADQTRVTFENIEKALQAVGMDFLNVLRTWCYNDDILAWYGEFNTVRNQFFTERGVFDKWAPASTGIGGSNPSGSALVLGALAIQPHSEDTQIFPVTSPLQCPALDYGSSFSRAAEIDFPDRRYITISGTASIEPGGETVHLDDMVNQVKLTMEVAEAILSSRGMSWGDAVKFIAYVRNPEQAGAFADYCRENALPILPAVVAGNIVCRDNLLFELELDAVVVK